MSTTTRKKPSRWTPERKTLFDQLISEDRFTRSYILKCLNELPGPELDRGAVYVRAKHLRNRAREAL